MTTAAAATIGIGPQGAMEQVATGFYRFPATAVDLDAIDELREGVPEISGVAQPTFPYKPGPMVGGGFVIQPRMENTLGWMLYSLLGDLTTVPDGNFYDHTFSVKADDPTFIPWISARKHIPRMNGGATTDLGMLFTDCKILSGMIALGSDTPVTTRFDLMGRKFQLDHDPSVWTWENTIEEWNSVPLGCAVGGYLKLDSEEFAVINANVGFQNVPADIRFMKVYGDPYLLDIEVVQRRFAYDLTCLWRNPELYAKVHAGEALGTDWSSHPFTASFEVKAVSSVDADGEVEPYSLIISAPEVMMNQVGGVALGGNDTIILRFNGVALKTAAPENYATFTLRNKVASYDWPAAGSGS